MRVLLTGHRGFIGKNLVKYIEENTDWELSTYDWGSDFPGVIDQDWVIHVGAISSTTDRDLDRVIAQNYDFTKQLFDNCKRFGINMQYSSTASLYGMGTDFRESAPLDPRTPYAWSKYLCERHHRLYQGGNIVQGFRYFNVYGNGEEHKGDQASPVSKFTKQIRETGKLQLFKGSDKFLRDFICIDDVVDIVLYNRAESGIYDLGTGTPISFQEVAELVAEKEKGEIEYIDFPEHLKGKYQTNTKADMKWLGNYKFKSVKDYLLESP